MDKHPAGLSDTRNFTELRRPALLGFVCGIGCLCLGYFFFLVCPVVFLTLLLHVTLRKDSTVQKTQVAAGVMATTIVFPGLMLMLASNGLEHIFDYSLFAVLSVGAAWILGWAVSSLVGFVRRSLL